VLARIVLGGQTGVDRAALAVAVKLVLLGWLAIGLSGCAQPWKFSHGAAVPAASSGQSGPAADAHPASETAAGPQPGLPQPAAPQAAWPLPGGPPPAWPQPGMVPGPPPIQPAGAQPVGYRGPCDPNLGPMPPAGNFATGPVPADQQWLPSNLCPPPTSLVLPGTALPADGSAAASQPQLKDPLLARMWDRQFSNVCSDYRYYYSWPTGLGLLGGLGLAAGLANSDLDGEIQEWYHTHILSAESTHIANQVRPFGQGQNLIPVAAGLALLNDTGWLDNRPVLGEIGQWGDRVTRAYLVGGPPMLAMQYLLGGSRPKSVNSHSAWIPFSASNGVSGDAFISSCMFISAADMSDNFLAKGVFYAGSFLVPWERIDLNAHFLSQACLGWWMGFLACNAVNQTELAKHNVTIVPMVSPEMSGMGVMYQR